MSPAIALHEPVAAGEDPKILDRIRSADIHLTLWQRPLPENLAWLEALDWDAIDDLDFAADLDNIDAEIADGLREAGYPEAADRAALRDEIAALARRFSAIMDCKAVKIRLEVVETDACRKFHADHVAARLLMTLVGPGTQWVHAGKVAAGPIHHLVAGDVAFFKGRRWADEPAILHRSAPVAATGETRLLLVIDPLTTTSEAAALPSEWLP
ncbi:MAG: DUF1826 domain-containing protein [Sphingobium sp.]|nr:DUF1826 domain-containing protein [Sphingobium sp.]